MGTGYAPSVDAERRYAELAARETELAEAELERSRSAWLYALSHESGGMREHFVRIAAQARYEWKDHQERARQFEERAARAAAADRVETPSVSQRYA
jgi:hypothetical protein